jgi:hypothetical protein
MKIREGKYYRTRDGDVVGPMRLRKDQSWYSCYHQWNEDGGIFSSGAEHGLDLISEVYVSDTPPPSRLERYPAPPSAMLKPQDWRRLKPIEPSPEAKTLRDELEEKAALAILSGYYANPNLGPSKDTFGDVWDVAKEFVEARKK